jgi:hypothetical protein
MWGLYSCELLPPPRQNGTALILAASNGCLSSIDVLLRHGADVQAATPDGMTALLSAAAGGYRRCMDALIDAGAWSRDLTPSLPLLPTSLSLYLSASLPISLFVCPSSSTCHSPTYRHDVGVWCCRCRRLLRWHRRSHRPSLHRRARRRRHVRATAGSAQRHRCCHYPQR